MDRQTGGRKNRTDIMYIGVSTPVIIKSSVVEIQNLVNHESRLVRSNSEFRKTSDDVVQLLSLLFTNLYLANVSKLF